MINMTNIINNNLSVFHLYLKGNFFCKLSLQYIRIKFSLIKVDQKLYSKPRGQWRKLNPFLNISVIALAVILCSFNFQRCCLFLHPKDSAHDPSKNPAKVGDSRCFKNNASPISRSHHQELHELSRVKRSNYLWHKLCYNYDHNTSQESSLEKKSLNPVWNRKQEPRIACPVNSCKFGSEEHQADDKDLTTHQKPFHIIRMECILSKPVCLWM